MSDEITKKELEEIELPAKTPGEIPPEPPEALVAAGTTPLGLHDGSWSPEEWETLLRGLVTSGMASWKEIAALVLGHLNPSQVGTSLASSAGFKKRYGKGKTMRVVMEWAYGRDGKCMDCGTRLELQADHVRAREEFKDPLDADFIENMTLRCRRCNVVRRPSHEFGGLTYLTAESALMWILLVVRPRTFIDYIRLCRMYGMTMADIRMGEAWAMAHWLSRDKPPLYAIENDAQGHYDVLLWTDSSVTRIDRGQAIPEGARCIANDVSGNSVLGFVTQPQADRFRFYEYPIDFIPFSTYDLGERPKQDLAVRYIPPDREQKKPQQITPLPPRNMRLRCYAVRASEQCFYLIPKQPAGVRELLLGPALTQGRVLALSSEIAEFQLVARAKPRE